jgi:hypothetical protein
LQLSLLSAKVIRFFALVFHSQNKSLTYTYNKHTYTLALGSVPT